MSENNDIPIYRYTHEFTHVYTPLKSGGLVFWAGKLVVPGFCFAQADPESLPPIGGTSDLLSVQASRIEIENWVYSSVLLVNP